MTDHIEPLPPASPWMTRDEAAEYLRVSRSKLDEMIRKGVLTKHVLYSASVRLARDEVEAAIVPASTASELAQ